MLGPSLLAVQLYDMNEPGWLAGCCEWEGLREGSVDSKILVNKERGEGWPAFFIEEQISNRIPFNGFSY